jgi:hypothetical protein
MSNPKINQNKLARVDCLQGAIASLNQQRNELFNLGEVAPPGCWVARYQVRSKGKIYWYYKLQSMSAIFPSQSGRDRPTKYRHLGAAGTSAHVNAVMQVLRRRSLIEEVEHALDALNESLLDVGFDT